MIKRNDALRDHSYAMGMLAGAQMAESGRADEARQVADRMIAEARKVIVNGEQEQSR